MLCRSEPAGGAVDHDADSSCRHAGLFRPKRRSGQSPPGALTAAECQRARGSTMPIANLADCRRSIILSSKSPKPGGDFNKPWARSSSALIPSSPAVARTVVLPVVPGAL